MYEKIRNITSLTQSKLGLDGSSEPLVGIVLGSGLGGLVDRIENSICVSYSEISGFPTSTVEGHQGQFVAGRLGGKLVVAMQGRLHYYEGYSMDEVSLGVRVMCSMGIKTLIVTNAAGGVNPAYRVGDVMLIEDHINLLPNPLVGPNISQIGERFVDMSQPYDQVLRDIAIEASGELSVDLRRGVYLASSGPTYETPVEYRFFHTIGADACGMSTVPEVIVARHAGVAVLGFSIITNQSNWQLTNNLHKNSHTEVVRAGQEAGAKLTNLIELCIQKL